MALPAATVWEVQTGGDDSLNSGGFVAGATGTDYSQQAAAQYSGTDLVVDGTTNTKVTSVSHNFVSADVGNLLRIKSGTGWTAGFYQIVSVAAGAATLDRSPAATSTTGGSYAVGGAFASLGQAVPTMVSGNTCWLKTGTYNVSSTIAANNNLRGFRFEGYGTVRGDGIHATLKATAAITVWSLNNFDQGVVRYLNFDGNGLTGTNGLVMVAFGATGSLTYILDCKFFNFSGSGFVNAGLVCFVDRCEAFGNAKGFDSGIQGGFYRNCYSHGNTGNGFYRCSGGVFVGCISAANGGIGFEYFGPGQTIFEGCVAYGNASHGFGAGDTSLRIVTFQNCISYSNGGFGYSSTTSTATFLVNSASGNNTSGAMSGVTSYAGNVSLASDPFTNGAGGDFSLNATTGGGAACRAAGFPGVFPGGTTTGFADIGAVQHQDVGGSNDSTILSRIFGGF